MISGKIAEQGGPVMTYAMGFGQFAELIGISPEVGIAMGALAINSFILTSLDTATRLTRYQIQELSNYKIDKYTATIVAVVGAVALLKVKTTTATGAVIPASAAIWPIFGSANQLVAALAFGPDPLLDPQPRGLVGLGSLLWPVPEIDDPPAGLVTGLRVDVLAT